MGQGAGDGDALLLAAGEFVRKGVAPIRQPYLLQQLQNTASIIGRNPGGGN